METHAVIHFLDCRGRKGECGPCCGVSISPTLLLAEASHVAAPNLRGREGDSFAMACGQIAAILWPNQDSEVPLPLWPVWRGMGTTSAIPTAKRDARCVKEKRSRTATKYGHCPGHKPLQLPKVRMSFTPHSQKNTPPVNLFPFVFLKFVFYFFFNSRLSFLEHF